MRPGLDVVALRREFHARPELGFLEFRTAARVAEALAHLGFQLSVGEGAMAASERGGVPSRSLLAREIATAAGEGVAKRWLTAFEGGMTAVVGTLEGHRTGAVIGFRFDLDALPIEESDGQDHAPACEGFRSERPGLMHACGHDGHAAIGLALASRLADREFAGTVRLIFQPAEEGLRGARAVADSGVVDGVSRLYCMHLGLGIETGTVYGAVEGLLASSKVRARFRGREAHAGLAPEHGANALLAAATAVVALHGLPQYAGDGTRLNVGVFRSGTAANIVPGHAELALETRARDSDAERALATAARASLDAAGAGLGVEVETEQIGGAPAVRCDPGPARRVVEVAAGLSGLTPASGPHRDSGSDDASWLLDRVRANGGDGTYIAFGSSSPSGHHTPQFDLDERSLPLAVRLLEALARSGE